MAWISDVALQGALHNSQETCCTILKAMCGTPTAKTAVLEDSQFARRWWRVSRLMIGQVFSERNNIQRHPRTQMCSRIKETRFNAYGAFVPAQNWLLRSQRFHYYPGRAFLNSHHRTR